jgi:OmpA-OmpF porin, OOP family
MRAGGISLGGGICMAAASAIILMVPGVAAAKVASTPGYLVDAEGRVVVSASGFCIRTGQWTPAMAIERCDPDLARRNGVRLQSRGAPRTAPPGAEGALLPEQVSYTVEALFGFDQAELSPEGKTILDRLSQTIGTTDYDVIVATGHADRLGGQQYNEELSRRRSEAVKAYLVSKGVPSDRIQTRALGELAPETRPGDCSGSRSELIECLQPDRRVDVEATGRQARRPVESR